MSWSGQSWRPEQPRFVADLTGGGRADIVSPNGAFSRHPSVPKLNALSKPEIKKSGTVRFVLVAPKHFLGIESLSRSSSRL